VAITVGLCIGLALHTTAVALGLAAVVFSLPGAYNLIATFGAGYLLYLAGDIIFRTPVDQTRVDGDTPPFGIPHYLQRGILMNVTNPKVALFFMAYLPQFADPTQDTLAPQLAVLGGVFIVVTLVVFGGAAVMAGTFGRSLSLSKTNGRFLRLGVGAIFASLAGNLFFTAITGMD
jgi:threonine/homoserine/homoserine lactone efflux protein